MHEDIFDLPLMDTKFTWSGELLEAMIVFSKFHLHEMAGKLVEGEEGHWTQYIAAVNRLLVHLEGGLRKKVVLVRHKKIIQKQQEDIVRMKGLPSVQVMQQAVFKAYRVLKLIGERADSWQGQLPMKVRGLANSCLVGAIWLDGFGGRKMEWENLSYTQVDGMDKASEDFLLMDEHKTSRTYGTLAKWLSPGVLAAVKCYKGLPRPEGANLFFIPACSATQKVDIPKCLQSFANRFLPQECTKPTVNLMRKYFHKALINLTKDEQSCKQLLTTLDAHSSRTIDRRRIAYYVWWTVACDVDEL